MRCSHEIRQLAAGQHSVVARRQLLGLGLTPSQIQHLVRTGALERLGPQTYAIGGAALTTERDALAAVLDAGAGAALGGPSALAWWDLPGYRVRPLHVVRPHGRGIRTHRLARIHVTRALPAHHVTLHRGVPVLTPARALFDAAAAVAPPRLERLVEKAWARNLVNGRVLHSMLGELEASGRVGIPAMRAVLATRPPGYVPHDSGQELRLTALLRDDGQAPMVRQVEVSELGGGWIGRVDFVDPEADVIVEVQSLGYHGTTTERAADLERVAALEAAGYEVVEVTEHELWHEPGPMLQRIREARARGRARRARARAA